MKTLKYAVRFLTRAKAYTVINLLGLSFSLACCIMLARYIHRELTVDTHCADRTAICGIVEQMEGASGLHALRDEPGDSGYIAPHFFKNRTLIKPTPEGSSVEVENHRYTAKVIGADEHFFELFPYRCVQGTVKDFPDRQVWVKESFARKVFGKENPIGKRIRFERGTWLTIGGVLAEPDNKTLLQFDALFPMSVAKLWQRMPIEFVQLQPNADVKELERLAAIPRWVNPRYRDADTRQYTLSFVPLKELYWRPEITSGYTFNGGIASYVEMLIGVCLLLFLSGVINFMNLYLVASQKRGKEYGVKRVFGIHLSGLFRQLWLESFLLIGAALVLAWIWVTITQPLWAKTFSYDFTYTAFDWLLTAGMLVLLPLLTSVYSLVKYSRMSPLDSIHSIAQGARSIKVRMSFLFVQYLFCMLIVILSLYFNKQLNLFLQTDPGFRTENVLYANLIHESEEMYGIRGDSLMQAFQKQRERIGAIDNKLKACPLISHCTHDYDKLLNSGFKMTFTAENGRKVDVLLRYVSPEFFKLYELKITEGNIDAAKIRKEHNYHDYMVLNQAAMKAFGFKNLEGAAIAQDSELRQGRNEFQPVIAVVSDFYIGHLSAGVQPTLFQVSEGSSGNLYHIAYPEGKLNELLEYLRQIEMEVYGNEDFEYSLLTDDVDKLYKDDRMMVTVYLTFAFIAIVISCLGLFGLSLFDIRQRYREIGIRKVNGAKLKDIYLLLIQKYVRLLAISFVVSVPVAVAIIYQYTLNFAVKAPIGVGIFVVALLIVALISLGTLYWQVNKAARINPADVIKTE